MDVVAVEIPLPFQPPGQWEPVWQEISNARPVPKRGERTAWRDCALAVRRALEEWRNIEPEQKTANTPLQKRTREERLDDLRLHWKNFADKPAHAQVDD